MHDDPGACAGGDERNTKPYRHLTTARFSGSRYVFETQGNSFNVYRMSSSPTPSYVGSWTLWSTPFVGDWDFRCKDVAVLDDYQYALVSYYNEGYYVAQLNLPSNQVSLVKMVPMQSSSSSTQHFHAELFRASGGAVYVVSRNLTPDTNNALSIYTFSDPNNIQLVTALGSETQYSGMPDSDAYDILSSGGSSYLYARTATGVSIWNISNPSSPVGLGSVGGAIYDLHVDDNPPRLYTISYDQPTVRAYSLDNPAAPALLLSYPLSGLGSLAAGVTVSGTGDLLVAGAETSQSLSKIRLISLSAPAAPFEVDASPYDPEAYYCEYNFDSLVFNLGTQYLIWRAANSTADLYTVQGSCLNTDPHTAFDVSGGSTACSSTGVTPTAPSTAIAGRGFVGDTFTISDGSYGEIATRSLTITPVGGTTPVFSSTSAGPWTWNTSGDASLLPGEYLVTQTLTGVRTGTQVFTLTKSIWLCTEQANLASSPAGTSFLQGDTVTLDAGGSQGHPTSFTFVYTTPGVADPVVTNLAATTGHTVPLILASSGSYTAFVVAHYLHSAPDSGTCGTEAALYLQDTYDACASLPPFTAGLAAASFVAKQNGTVTTSPLINLETVLEFTGKVAVGYAPTFVWSPSPTVTIDNCAYTLAAVFYTGSTCKIPAGTLTVGTPVTIGLDVQVCLAGVAGQSCTTPDATVAAPAVILNPVSVTAGFTVSTLNTQKGAAVTLTLRNLSGSLSSLTYNLGGGITCDGATSISLACSIGACQNGVQSTVKFGNSGNFLVTLTGVPNPSGSYTSPDSYTISVAALGGCATAMTVTPSPNPAYVNNAVTFTFSPPVRQAGDTVTFTFGDGQTGTVPYSAATCIASFGYCSTIQHTYTSAGSFNVSVSGTLSGAQAAGSTSVTIQTSVSGTMTLVVSPNPVNQGAVATATFSPGVTASGDYVTVNWGDGNSDTVNFLAFACGGATGCNTANHTYQSGGSKTVTAQGIIGGRTYSASYPLTVQTSCAASVAPTANFTWNPQSPSAGQVIQFSDASTGGPTQWAWSFGDGTPPVVPSGTSTSQNPTYQYASAGTYTVTLTATNCKGSTQKQYQVVVAAACAASVAPAANFTWSPQAPKAGQVIQFTDASTGGPTSWAWGFGDGTPPLVPAGTSTSHNPTYQYASPGTYTVTLTATNCKGSNQKQYPVLVASACDAPGGVPNGSQSPASNSTRAGGTVTFQWSPSATGTQPFTYDLYLHLVGAPTWPKACTGVATTQCAVANVAESSTQYEWKVIAKNSCGETPAGAVATWRFTACSGTRAPIADFTWQEQGVLDFHGIQQNQPYVGQLVHFIDRSDQSPSAWSWSDFMGDPPGTSYSVQNPTHTFSSAGGKTVRMVATNCKGASAEKSLSVQVYADDRPVFADFTIPGSPSTSAPVALAARTGFDYGDPHDFNWVFGDGTTGTGASVTHLYSCAGSYQITLTVSRGTKSATKTQTIAVGGFICCAAPGVPAADFDWTPSGTIELQGVQQCLPYVGQAVQFNDHSSNSPDHWSWYDFQSSDVTYTDQNPVHTFTSPGTKNVRMKARNCAGESTEKLKQVVVCADVRPVVADFTWSPASPATSQAITFTAKQGASYGDPNDFTWSGDLGNGTGPQWVVPGLQCKGSFAVTLTVKRGSATQAVTKTVTVTGNSCCNAPGIPVADFSWSPQGPYPGEPQQLQPFVGQAVQLQDLSSNSPSEWSWTDFQQKPGATYTVQNPVHTWFSTGAKNVRLRASNCAGSSATTLKVVTVYADVRKVTADFTIDPASPQTGQQVTGIAKQGFEYGSPSDFSWRFSDDGSTAAGPAFLHTYSCQGTFQITLTAKRGTFSGTTTKAVTVGGFLCCEAPTQPTSPQPPSGATVPGGVVVLQWSRPAKGTDAITYDVFVDGAKRCADVSGAQCMVADVAESSTSHVWKVVAKNACYVETSSTSSEWRFKACSPSGPPVPEFTWEPNGPLPSFPDQLQPYEGQPVHFLDASSNTPTAWLWSDFQQNPGAIYTDQNPWHTFSSSSNKNVRLKVTNCAGSSSTLTKVVTVYRDRRPVQAEFSYTPTDPQALVRVFFTAEDGDDFGNPNGFTWDFGDGTPPVDGKQVEHIFPCSKHYTVALTAKRTKGTSTYSGSTSKEILLGGTRCSPEAMLIVDLVRELPTASGGVQRSDMVVYNPSTTEEMPLTLSYRITESGQTGQLVLPPLPPKGSMTLADIVSSMAGARGASYYSSTFYFARGDDRDDLPVITAWTAEETNGNRYGQLVPVFSIWPPAAQATTQWITGLLSNGATAERNRNGFRTVITIVNPRPDGWGSRVGKLGLYRLDGSKIKEISLNLGGWDYRQLPLTTLFGIANTDLGAVNLKMEVPAGVNAVVSAAMIDNASQHAVVLPGQSLQ